MTQHHALFIFDRSQFISTESFRKSVEWMDFDAKLWANQFEGFFAYSGAWKDLNNIPREYVAFTHAPSDSGGSSPPPSATLDDWARARGHASADDLGGDSGGHLFPQTLLAVDMAQKQLASAAHEATVSRICIFSNFFQRVPKLSQFAEFAPEHLKQMDLNLCAIAESDPKHVSAWAKGAEFFFRSVQVIHVDEHLASRRALDEATHLADSVSVKTKRTAKPNRASSI